MIPSPRPDAARSTLGQPRAAVVSPSAAAVLRGFEERNHAAYLGKRGLAHCPGCGTVWRKKQLEAGCPTCAAVNAERANIEEDRRRWKLKQQRR
jgi:hypothetical protein